jgi:hypothetical protein
MKILVQLVLLCIVVLSCPAQDNNKKLLTVRVVDSKVWMTKHISILTAVEGDGMRYKLICGWPSFCRTLTKGDSLQAEIRDQTMWLTVRDLKKKKEVRMKSQILNIVSASSEMEPLCPANESNTCLGAKD